MTAATRPKALDLQTLLASLQIETLDTYLFRGLTEVKQLPQIYGGQVLAQAVNAASHTVDTDRGLHSLHSYFLRRGDPHRAILYEVDPIRDGSSFTTRRVVAKQNGRAIFNAAMSFQVNEEGLEHQQPMPQIPAPEAQPTESEFWQDAPFGKQYRPVDIGQYDAFETRVLSHRDPRTPQPSEPKQGMWIKTSQAIGQQAGTHAILLAYISDMFLIGASLKAHPVYFWTQGLQAASLDHAIWFHAQPRVDDWLYYHMESPISARSRGFNHGSFYTQSGQLVASVTQESLIRMHPPNTQAKPT